MKSKFSLRPAATASTFCLVWFLAANALLAQVPPPTSVGAAKPKVAHVRFFNLLPLDGGILQLFAGASADGQPLQVAPPSNFYAVYTNFPPVRTTFRVFRPDNRQTPVKSVDAPLKADGYFTLLAHLQPDGQPTVELIDETPNPDLPPATRLTVRQFCHGAQVVVTAAGAQHTKPLGYGESQTLTNVPDGDVPLLMIATMTAGGQPRTLNLGANFQRSRQGTVFIVTDPYDRLRPRVTSDGPSRAEEDAAAAALHGAGSPVSAR